MIQGQGDQADWQRVTKATGGPDTDYSNMGRCTGTDHHQMYRVGQNGGTNSSSKLQCLEQWSLNLVLMVHLPEDFSYNHNRAHLNI